MAKTFWRVGAELFRSAHGRQESRHHFGFWTNPLGSGGDGEVALEMIVIMKSVVFLGDCIDNERPLCGKSLEACSESANLFFYVGRNVSHARIVIHDPGSIFKRVPGTPLFIYEIF